MIYKLIFDLAKYGGGTSTAWLLHRTGASSGKYLVSSWFAAPVGVALLPYVSIFFPLGLGTGITGLGFLVRGPFFACTP